MRASGNKHTSVSVWSKVYMIIDPSGFGGQKINQATHAAMRGALIVKNCSAKQLHGEGRLRPFQISKVFAVDNAKVLNFPAQKPWWRSW